MKNFWIKSLATLGLVLAITGCSSGGNCSSCTSNTSPPGSLSLSLNAPTQYPAGVALTIAMTITNTSSVNGSNLVYTVPRATNYTGVDITINPTGVADSDCTFIAIGQSCTFTATIPAGSHPGSFTVLASTNASGTSASTIPLQVGNSTSVTANLGLVDIPTTQNAFYILPTEQSIPVGENNSIAYISLYNQSYLGDFASLNWYDEAGTKLNNVAY